MLHGKQVKIEIDVISGTYQIFFIPLHSSLAETCTGNCYLFLSWRQHNYCGRIFCSLRFHEMEVGYNLHRSRRINERITFKKEVLFSTGPFFFLER